MSFMLYATKEGDICAVVIGDGTKNFAKTLTPLSYVLLSTP